ncbi:MAG TPA: lipopolysaccharide biosynthesis protein [Thermoplasmata archaeon]|nr:lipopolysaccharide biosynthesis protein [Thermoplasmata archaeon]
MEETEPGGSGYRPSADMIARFGSPAAPASSEHVPTQHGGLGRSSLGVFILTTLIQVMGVAATTVLGHTFSRGNAGQAVLGELALFLLLASSINWLGDLRIGAAYTFFVSRGQPAKELTGTYLTLRIALVGGFSAGSLVAIYAFSSLRGVSFSAAEWSSLGAMLVLPLLWTPWMVVSQLRVARGQSITAQYPQVLEVGLRSALIIAVMAFALHNGSQPSWVSPGIATFTFAYVAGGVASFLYCLPELWRETSAASRDRASQMLRYSWPLMGSLMFQFLASNMPVFFVAGLLANTALVNAFNWANGFRILLLSIPSAVVLPLFPYLASQHARGEYDAVQRKTWDALRFAALILLPCALALVVYRVPVAVVLQNGSISLKGSASLAILAVSAFPFGLSQVIGAALNSVGYQRLELYLSATVVAAMAGSTVILFLFFPVLEVIAVGVLIASVAALVLNAYFMEVLLRVRVRPWPILRIALAGILAFASLALLNRYINPSRWFALPLAILAGLTVYVLVLAAIGELTKDDVRVVCGAVGFPDRVAHQLSRMCWRESPPA